jgi:hypothetical protein
MNRLSPRVHAAVGAACSKQLKVLALDPGYGVSQDACNRSLPRLPGKSVKLGAIVLDN